MTASVWVTAAVGAAAGAGLVLLAADTTVIYLLVVAMAFRVLTRWLPRPSSLASALRVRYTDGHGVLRLLLHTATARGFIIDELSAEPVSQRMLHAVEMPDGKPLGGVRLHVHGRYPVSELAAALSEIDDVASVRVGEDPLATE